MKKQLFLILLLSLNILFISGKAKVQNKIINPSQPLMIAKLVLKNNKSLNILRSYLYQMDKWSCGLRTMMHALAIEKASTNAKKFESNLKINLSNQKTLSSMEDYYFKNLVCECGDLGLHPYAMRDLAKKYGFGGRFLVVKLKNNKLIDYEGYEVKFNKPKKASLKSLTKAPINKRLSNMVNRAKKLNKPLYIAAVDDNHWILFAIVFKPKATLYTIDSQNWGFTKNIANYLNYLMKYIDSDNKK